MCEMKKYFYFQLETNIEVELLCGKLEFSKFQGLKKKKKTVIWDRQVLPILGQVVQKAGLDKQG